MNKQILPYIYKKDPEYSDIEKSKIEKSSISIELNHYSYEGNLNEIIKEKKNERKKILELENMRKIEKEKLQKENLLNNSYQYSINLKKGNSLNTSNNESNDITNKKKEILFRANTFQSIFKRQNKQQFFVMKLMKKDKSKRNLLLNKSKDSDEERTKNYGKIKNIKDSEEEDFIDENEQEWEKEIKLENFLNKLRKNINNIEKKKKIKKIEYQKEEQIKKEKFQNMLIKIDNNRKRIEKERKKKIEREEFFELERKKILEEELKKEKKKEELRKMKEKAEELRKKQLIEEELKNKKEKEEYEKKRKEKEEERLKILKILFERERRQKEEEENRKRIEMEELQLKINILRKKIEIKKEEKIKYNNLNGEELKHKWRIEKINTLLDEFLNLKNDDENIEEKLTIVNELGKYFKKEIEYDKKYNKTNFFTIEEAIDNNDTLINFFGILSNEFKSYGIDSIIEKKSSDLNLIEKIFQLFLSEFSIQMKYKIEIKNYNLIQLFKKDISKYFSYLENFKSKITNIFNLNKTDLYFFNNDIDNFKITLVIYKRRDIDINIIKKEITITKKNLLHSIKFYLDFFDNKYNRLNDNWETTNFKRGGEIYNPPYSWNGFALRVLNKFDNGNNLWLENKGKEGEWAIGYHGIEKGNIFRKLLNIIKENLKSGPGQLYNKYPNIRDNNKSKVGYGVYLSCDINEAEKFSEVTIVGQYKLKFIIMCRVNPYKIREPKGYPLNWVVDGNYDCLRPYRILVKKIKWFQK